jgi:hypothetical protein
MKLPSLKIKFSFSSLINPVLILVILLEAYMVYANLYTNLDPQPTEVVLNKIVKVDLKAYNEIMDLIQAKQNFAPAALNLSNQNPFKYNK